jgi:hypothetical protein
MVVLNEEALTDYLTSQVFFIKKKRMVHARV